MGSNSYFFPGTRDAKESFELWAKYLENRKIGIYSRQLAAMEQNKAYDLFKTTQGKLWHRIEYPEVKDGDAGEEQVS